MAGEGRLEWARKGVIFVSLSDEPPERRGNPLRGHYEQGRSGAAENQMQKVSTVAGPEVREGAGEKKGEKGCGMGLYYEWQDVSPRSGE